MVLANLGPPGKMAIQMERIISFKLKFEIKLQCQFIYEIKLSFESHSKPKLGFKVSLM